jgi:signal transduction histidine kinase
VKITQKFLVFALIPAVFQSIVFVQLLFSLQDLVHYAEEEAHQSAVESTLVLAMSASVEVAVATSAYAATPMEAIGEQLEISQKKADKVFATLRNMTADDPVTHSEIEQLITLGDVLKKDFFFQKLHTGENPEIADDSPVKNVDWEKLQYGRRFAARTKQMTKILARQNVALQELRDKQEKSRANTQRLITIEAILGLAMIAILYVLFRHDFGRRFNDLLLIAQDLALDRTPTKIVRGRDELAELSDALLTAAEARREAVAQKQMLFQMVTHDLRSPLMAASVVVDTLIHDEKATPEKRQNRLQSVDRSLQRVVGLANDLLTIERLSAGGLEISRTRVDIKQTVEHAIETVLPLAEQKHCSLANNAPSLNVFIDEDRILQVIVNLLGNAIKYSPQGEVVEISAALDGSRLRVEVMDRGPGISDKDLKRLFNPFQQVSESDKTKGFGLGLTIAKMLVELHDGKIGANARAGGGTTFWFTLRLT